MTVFCKTSVWRSKIEISIPQEKLIKFLDNLSIHLRYSEFFLLAPLWFSNLNFSNFFPRSDIKKSCPLKFSVENMVTPNFQDGKSYPKTSKQRDSF